jgi:ubiquinone/menaquinone biosynthesis C-methylase UbiE
LFWVSCAAAPSRARTHIVDLATGSGDIPRLIADYAWKLDAQVEVDAFDQQSATLEIATTLSADYPEISYREFSNGILSKPTTSCFVLRATECQQLRVQ